MNPTIKVSIPYSFYDDVLYDRELGVSWPDSVFGKMQAELDKALENRSLGRKKNFYILLTAEDLQDIIDLCEQDLENDWSSDLFPPYRYMLKQAKKKLAELNSK
jgi:hypothetical protein